MLIPSPFIPAIKKHSSNSDSDGAEDLEDHHVALAMEESMMQMHKADTSQQGVNPGQGNRQGAKFCDDATAAGKILL